MVQDRDIVAMED